MSTPWDPDYVVGPGPVLADWLTEHGLTTRLAMSMIFPREHRDEAASRLDEIIAGAPLSQPVAEWLAALPLCPGVKFWMALEHNYRVGLAAGKKDFS